MSGDKFAIAWSQLTYKVGPGLLQKEKTILSQLYGSVEFGAITALMGPSGAGKTTLLKCLNGKLSSGLCPNSKIMVNNKVPIISTFVGQHAKEQLILGLTVQQNLIYASKFKNSNDGHIDHELNAKNIMNELMLEDIWDNRVDSCSGGQQKRLTIAIEMTPIVKPNVLCIDEPTTGLDSNIAEMVMNSLQNLSERHNIAVIASIHQPNHEIVMMFNKVYVLAKGGHCIHSGSPDGIGLFLKECRIMCDEDHVPVEQLLKLASIEEQNNYTQQMIIKTKEILCSEIQSIESQMKVCPNGLKTGSKAFNFMDICHLSGRSMAQIRSQQWKIYLMKLVFYILFPIVITSLFNEEIGKPSGCFEPGQSKTCSKDIEDDDKLVQNQAFLYFVVVIGQFIHLCYSTITYINDTKIFVNEHSNGWYSTASFYWSKLLMDITPTIIFSLMFGFIVYYWSEQIYEEHRLVKYMILVMLSFLCTEGWGQNIGIFFANYETVAITIAVAMNAVMAILVNFFIKINDMPLVFQFTSDFIAYPRLYYDSARIVIYGLDRCSPTEKPVLLVKYNLTDDMLYPNIYKFIVYAIFTKILALFALYMKTSFDFSKMRLWKQKNSKSIKNETNTGQVDQVAIRRLSNIMEDFQFNLKDNNDKDNKFAQRMCIGFTNLTLRIPKTFFQNEKVILNRINGYFEFFSLNALMGSSGAGKTSLLKSINGLNANYLTNDTKIFLSKFRPIKTCFVTQDERDHIMTGITAGEAMTYASKLKNSDHTLDHKKNVEELMKELLIFNTFDTLVDKCSGGEQKRLVIAMELTAKTNKPNLLCIDEPTSGLDSYAAEVVMQCLRRLSLSHEMCIITSIHQPSSDILSMFDKVFVLSRGGHCIYSGRPNIIRQYLNQSDAIISKNQLPIESLLKYSCYSPEEPTIQQMIRITSIGEFKIVNERVQNEANIAINGIRLLSKRFFIRDFLVLFKRRVFKIIRDEWRLIGFQSVFYIVFGLVLIWVYNLDIGGPSGCVNLEDDFNNTCAKTVKKIREEELLTYNINYNFYVVAIIIFFCFIVPSLTFSSDLTLFLNEHRNGWYSTGTYYWSKSLIDFFPMALTLLIYCYIVDIYDQSIYFWYFTFITIGCFNVQTIGQTLAIIYSDNQRIAVFASVTLFLFSMMFSNLIVKIKELHYVLQAICKLTPIKLVLDCILIAMYGFDRCTDREFSYPLWLFDIEDNDFYMNAKILFVQFFILRAISLSALLLKVKPKDKKYLPEESQSCKKLLENKSQKLMI